MKILIILLKRAQFLSILFTIAHCLEDEIITLFAPASKNLKEFFPGLSNLNEWCACFKAQTFKLLFSVKNFIKFEISVVFPDPLQPDMPIILRNINY